jgi:hypothetical protein
MPPQVEIKDAIIAKDAFGLQPAKTELTDDIGRVFFPGNDGLSSFDIEVLPLAAHSLLTDYLHCCGCYCARGCYTDIFGKPAAAVTGTRGRRVQACLAVCAAVSCGEMGAQDANCWLQL